VHGIRRDARNEARQKEPRDTNSNGKCARESLSRYKVTIANRETGDEGEKDRISDGPSLEEPNHPTQSKLNREN